MTDRIKEWFLQADYDIDTAEAMYIHLSEKIQLEIPEETEKLFIRLGRDAIRTRYPDQLQKIQSEYKAENTKILLDKSKEMLKWLKAM